MATKRTTRNSNQGDTGRDDYQNGNADGFLNAKRHQPRDRRVGLHNLHCNVFHLATMMQVKWTPVNDRKLLIVWGGKEVTPAEYPVVATLFPGELTPNRTTTQC